MDGIGGCVWVTTAGRASVMCTGSFVAVHDADPTPCESGAHDWYATASTGYKCSHGCTGVPNTGPVVNRETPNSMFPALMLFDPADLAAVNAGKKADYSVEPQMVDLQRRFRIQTAPVDLVGGNKNIKAGFFDPAARRLYLVSTQADNSTPGAWSSLVHVFESRSRLTAVRAGGARTARRTGARWDRPRAWGPAGSVLPARARQGPARAR
jgi:hypothetical protein